MKRNITLCLEKGLICKDKILAAKREPSLSKPLADSLLRALEDEDFYEVAKRMAFKY